MSDFYNCLTEITIEEFNNVMKVTGISDLDKQGNHIHRSFPDYFWKDFKIWYNTSFPKSYATVRGRIPLEVAMIIYHKYPSNPYGICHNSFETSTPYTLNPYTEAVDDILLNSRKDGATENLINEFHNRSNDQKYLKRYNIYTKEGLLIFITEMQDYYLRKQFEPETEVQKLFKLVQEVEKMVNESEINNKKRKLEI